MKGAPRISLGVWDKKGEKINIVDVRDPKERKGENGHGAGEGEKFSLRNKEPRAVYYSRP